MAGFEHVSSGIGSDQRRLNLCPHRDCYISEIVHQLRDPSQAHGGVRAGGAVRMPISHLETRDVTTL